MARQKSPDSAPEQIELIDVDLPGMKDVKKQITEYEALKVENLPTQMSDRPSNLPQFSKDAE